METGNEYAHKGETIYLSQQGYLVTLDTMANAWNAGRTWSRSRSAWPFYCQALLNAQEWQREDRTND